MKTKDLLIAILISALFLLAIRSGGGAVLILLAAQWFLPYSYLMRPRGDLKRIEAAMLAVLIPFFLWGAAALYWPCLATPMGVMHGRRDHPLERVLYLAYAVVFLLAIAKLGPRSRGGEGPPAGRPASRIEEILLPRFRLAVGAVMSALFVLDCLGLSHWKRIIIYGNASDLAILAVPAGFLLLHGYLIFDGFIARRYAREDGLAEPAGSILYDGWLAAAWAGATGLYLIMRS